MTEEAAVEKMIVMKGLTAPRITPTDVTMAIVGVQYIVFPGSQTTVCELTLANGFRVTGESACASPENFDKDIGEQVAFENARNKVWAFLGYELRTKLHLVALAGILPPDDPFLALGEVQTYVGTKVIRAIPMDRGDYNIFKGWELPAGENPRDEGYLVMYADGGKPNVPGFSGYISWSPRDVFEKAYQQV